MKSIRHTLAAPIVAIVLAGCSGGFVVVESGPPPYAPANGYRHRHPHDHIVLVYNADLSVYAVSGYRNCYYSGGTYYRVDGGVWYRTVTISEPTWTVVSYNAIPPGLHKKYKDSYADEKEKKHKKKKKYGNG